MQNRHYARPLNAGGRNAQGVPFGLVNWMIHNRLQTGWMDGGDRRPKTRAPMANGRPFNVLTPTVWRNLSLTRACEFASRGFMDIATLDRGEY